jgi:hypothetical protein
MRQDVHNAETEETKMTIELNQIAAATDANNHWKAALIIANELGEAHEKELLSSIEFTTFERGESYPHEIAARSATVNAILARYPVAFADTIRKAL